MNHEHHLEQQIKERQELLAKIKQHKDQIKLLREYLDKVSRNYPTLILTPTELLQISPRKTDTIATQLVTEGATTLSSSCAFLDCLRAAISKAVTEKIEANDKTLKTLYSQIP